MSQGMAVRFSLLSAAIWWAAFTFIPYRGLRNREPVAKEVEPGGLMRQSFGQLFATLREMRSYPMTLTFLVAYLFFNDGIQTVIATSSTFGEKELGFETEVLIATILLVQFVAFGGALLFGRIATNLGSKKTILGGLVVWMVIVSVGLLPARERGRAVPRAGRPDRPGARRHPGTVAVVLQPAHPARPRGGVLQPLPGLRTRHQLARDLDLRPGAPMDRLLPTGGVRADHILRARTRPAGPSRCPARHRRGRQLRTRRGLTRSDPRMSHRFG